MLVQEQRPVTNARQDAALAYLAPAFDEARSTGRPSGVQWVPTSLSNSELVALAVELCRRCGANVAVLANRDANGVTFVPLA
jgi:hypothetical protein